MRSFTCVAAPLASRKCRRVPPNAAGAAAAVVSRGGCVSRWFRRVRARVRVCVCVCVMVAVCVLALREYI